MGNLLFLKKHPLPQRFNSEAIELLNLSVENGDIDCGINILERSLGVNTLIAEYLIQNYHHNYMNLSGFKEATMKHARDIESYHSSEMLEAIKFIFSINSNISLAIISKFDSFH